MRETQESLREPQFNYHIPVGCQCAAKPRIFVGPPSQIIRIDFSRAKIWNGLFFRGKCGRTSRFDRQTTVPNMEAVFRSISRQPVIVSGVILLLFAAGLWGAHDYIVNVVQPRQHVAVLNEIASETKDADNRLRLRQFDRALSTYQLLLKTRDAELRPQDKGRLHHQAGLCLTGLAQGENEKQNLGRALEHFTSALQFRTVASDPAGFAETQVAVGQVLLRLNTAQGKPEFFDKALAAFQEALQATSPESNAEAYSTVQIQIGNAYRDAFTPGQGQKDEDISPSLAAYESALRSATTAGNADMAAQVQLERGRAYLKLANGVFKRTNTRAALADFQAAIQVFDAKSHPQQHGRMQELLGDTYTKMFNEVEAVADTKWRAEAMRNEWDASAKRAYVIAVQFGAHLAGSSSSSK